VFGSVGEAILAKDEGTLDLQAKVRIRIPGLTFLEGEAPEGYERTVSSTRRSVRRSSTTRFPRATRSCASRPTRASCRRSSTSWPRSTRRWRSRPLDRIKDAGFYWATRSGVTVALSDVLTPPNKARSSRPKVQAQYEKGLTTDAERREELIKIWTEATDEVQAAMGELPGRQHHQPHGVVGCPW
jgi:DNA-directed RNA polymerase subunit beta'